jgi:hypothetical protein
MKGGVPVWRAKTRECAPVMTQLAVSHERAAEASTVADADPVRLDVGLPLRGMAVFSWAWNSGAS